MGATMLKCIAPRRFVIALAATCGIGLLAAPAAFGTITSEGPYGPISTIDGSTCGGHVWANFTNLNSTYFVSSITQSGSYNVTLKTKGRFTTIAGSSPNACGTGSDNGDTIKSGVKGSVSLTFYLVVSGGTFNPSAGPCDVTCASDPYTDTTGVSNFVSTFFGGSATWSFSTTKDAVEVAQSSNLSLCLNKWRVTTTGNSAITSSTGDIATLCN
jgi:hypothetical protein